MAYITKALALSIAKKLKAQVVKKTNNHDIAAVYHGDKLIAHFGIRRGSRKGLGHDHIPQQIFLSPRDARLLGQCPLQREDWIRILAEKNKL